MVTIVTVTYNNSDELLNTLNSIPSEDRIESVVINGGDEVYDESILKGKKGRVINEKDSGIAEAFNKGIKYSSGDHIMFLNSGDELLDKEYPLKALKILEEDKNTGFVHSNLLLDDQLAGKLVIKPRMKNLGRGMPFLHPTMVVRKKVFKKTGMFDESLKIAMDFGFVVNMYKNNIIGYYFDNKPVVKMNGEGKSIRSEAAGINECYKILKKENELTLTNIFGFLLRYLQFLMRKILSATGGGKFLGELKRKKYSSN